MQGATGTARAARNADNAGRLARFCNPVQGFASIAIWVARPAIAVSIFADSAIAIITEKTPTTVGVFNGNPFEAGTSF